MTSADDINDLLYPQGPHLPATSGPSTSLVDRESERPAGPRGKAPSRVALVIVTVFILVTLFLAVRLSNRGEDSSSAPPTTAAYVPSTRTDTAEERDRVAVENVSRDMIRAWLTRGTPDERRSAMARFATTQLVDRLVGYGTDYLPPGQLVGPPDLVVAKDGGASHWVSLSDGHAVGLNLVFRDGRWLVVDLQG